jgi:hypothetical protein
MIDRCFNPGCRRELHYLRDGRIVRVIRGKGDDVSLEHYWLCGACYLTHDFDFPDDGSVALRDRPGDKQEDDFYLRDVALPERRAVQR